MKILCRLGLHDNKTIAYGYFAFNKYYQIIYRCKRCGKLKKVTDDLFIESRPEKYRLNKDYVTYDL